MPPATIDVKAEKAKARSRSRSKSRSRALSSTRGSGGDHRYVSPDKSHRQLDEAINEAVRDMGAAHRYDKSDYYHRRDSSRGHDRSRQSGRSRDRGHRSTPRDRRESSHHGSPRKELRDRETRQDNRRHKDHRDRGHHNSQRHRDDRREDVAHHYHRHRDHGDRDHHEHRDNDDRRRDRRRKGGPTKTSSPKAFSVHEYIAMPSESESSRGFFLCGNASSDSDIMGPQTVASIKASAMEGRRGQQPHISNKVTSLSSVDSKEVPIWSDDHYYVTKQEHSVMSILVTAVELLVLVLQMVMCGVAPLDVNPMVGPFPDAFSDWGGKNLYLIVQENEYWRLITPAFLHVGVLHLLGNTLCLFYTAALFERDWGSWRWVLIFLMSEVGCIAISMVADPDTIAVGSSGALMGLFAGKLAEVVTYTAFTLNKPTQDDSIQMDQLSNVLCSLTLLSVFSSFTYLDWSGHMGGLATGFFTGMVLFCAPISSCCLRLLWGLLGLIGLGTCGFIVVYLLLNEIEVDKNLGDACQYFRNLYPEQYDCGCW